MNWNCNKKDVDNQFGKERNSLDRPIKHAFGAEFFFFGKGHIEKRYTSVDELPYTLIHAFS